jgi:hypothetical protein
VLDPDQPRRPVPVLGQHRVAHHLPVLDRAGRRADTAGQHDDAGTGGLGAVDAGLTPGGHFLYVDESEGKVVGAFAVNGGSLTELSSSPFALPSSASAAGIAVS